MLIVTCTTASNTFTENASTVNRERGVNSATEATAFTEAASTVNRARTISPASVEIVTLVENAAVVEIYRATVALTVPMTTTTIQGEAGLLNFLVDTAVGSSSFIGVMDFDLTDIAVVSDELRTFTTQLVVDTANASDSITVTGGPQLHETATATNTYGVVWDATISTGEWRRAGESFKLGLSEALTDVVNVTDVLTPSRINILHESGYASEVLAASTDANDALSSTVNASDSQVIGLGEALADTANANDVLTDTASPQAALTDTATATEVVTSIAGHYDLLVSVLTGVDTITFGSSSLNNVLHDTATVKETIWAADYAAIAWVLNTETAGLSTYVNFGFDSLVQHNGVLYGTNPMGLQSISGDDDLGRQIAANVKTGFLDFKARETKRISDLYVGYTGGELECDVETYDGPQEVYTYQLEERDADAPRNSRMKVGRGLSSRYWRFNLKNVNGADFQLYDMEANIGRSNRRL